MHYRPLSSFSALVLDAQDSHALSAIRSLGRQSVRVTAVSPKAAAMGLASRYCLRTLQSPNPGTDAAAYAKWLLAALQRESFDALLFFGEASANVVAEHRDAIRDLTGCMVPDLKTFLTADRKDQVARLAASIGVPVPGSHELVRPEDAPALLGKLTFPVIVKAVWGSGGHQVRFVARAEDFTAAVEQVLQLTAGGDLHRCLVQEYIPGTGYGFTALASEGTVVASFMHRRLSEHDVARGAQLAHAATGAESVDEPELRASGTALLQALGWDGMAMVEFRRSSINQRFYLMEVNPRFPGSLELAIAAGVDFPALYLQHAAGRAVAGPERYRVGLRVRWILSKGVAEAVEDPLGYARSVASLVRPDTHSDIALEDPRPHAVQLREAAWWTRQYLQARSPAAALRAHAARLRAWCSEWRSYVPVAFSFFTLAAMRGFTYPRGEHRLDLAWEGGCLLLGLCGLAIRVATIGFSAGRAAVREAGAPAAGALDTTGMYATARHPYRFGTLLMWLAVAAFPRQPWLPALALGAFWLYYRGAMQEEERSLARRFGAGYSAWAASTPMFVLRLWRFKRPQKRFALGRVLRREHTALFVLVSCFTILETVGELELRSRFTIDAEWASLFATTAILYATLLILKQRRYTR